MNAMDMHQCFKNLHERNWYYKDLRRCRCAEDKDMHNQKECGTEEEMDLVANFINVKEAKTDNDAES